MSYQPISKILPQYENYAEWWLKAYEQGTTTPKSMGDDSTPSNTFAKLQLDEDGFPKTSGGANLIPWIDGAFDLWLFPTEAEADANDTTNAKQLSDNIGEPADSDLNSLNPIYFPTVSAMQLSTVLDATLNQVVIIGERANSLWDVIAATTNNGYDVLDGTGSGVSLRLKTDGVINLRQLGAVEGGNVSSIINTAAAKIYVKGGGNYSGYLLVADGNYYLDDQVDLTGVNFDFSRATLTLIDNFPASPAVIIQDADGNAGAYRSARIRINGNSANQISTITDDDGNSVTDRVSACVFNFNWTGSEIHIDGEDNAILLDVKGNVENLILFVSGYNNKRLIQERPDPLTPAWTPDENRYYISSNSDQELFVQTAASQNTSCYLHFNAEQAGLGGSSPPVVITSNKVVWLDGEMRANHNGGVLIDGGASLILHNNLSLYATSDDWAYTVETVGTINGIITLQNSDQGGVYIKDVNKGGNLTITSDACSNNPALTLGVDSSNIAENLLIYLQSVMSDATVDLNAVYARDTHVHVGTITNGIDVGTCVGLSMSLPNNVIIDDIPITLNDANFPNSQSAGVEVRGAFTDAELQAYSTPFKTLRATVGRNQSGVMSYYTSNGATGGWQVPTMQDL